MNHKHAITMSFMVGQEIISLEEFLKMNLQAPYINQEIVEYANNGNIFPDFISVYAEAEEKDREDILNTFKNFLVELNIEFCAFTATDHELWAYLN